jgi:hypothetical protein
MKQLVYVTNKTDKPLVVDYGCQDINFPVGDCVKISLEAARHIFGYQHENKEPFMASLGFTTTTNDIPEGLKYLAKFEISEEEPQKNHSLSPVVERVPLPQKRGGGKFYPMTA